MLKQLVALCLTSTLCLGQPSPNLIEDWTIDSYDLAAAIAQVPHDPELTAAVLAAWGDTYVPIWSAPVVIERWVPLNDIIIVGYAGDSFVSYLVMVDGAVWYSKQAALYYHATLDSKGYCGNIVYDPDLESVYTIDPFNCITGYPYEVPSQDIHDIQR